MYIQMKVASQNFHLREKFIFCIVFRESLQNKLEMQSYDTIAIPCF